MRVQLTEGATDEIKLESDEVHCVLGNERLTGKILRELVSADAAIYSKMVAAIREATLSRDKNFERWSEALLKVADTFRMIK